MSTELIINASLPETRIALMENGEIQDLLIERASGKGIVGNIYKGRVTRVLPGMQAAFVDIGLEKAAFLYVDDVFVHSEIWEAEEVETEASSDAPHVAPLEGTLAAEAGVVGAALGAEPGLVSEPPREGGSSLSSEAPAVPHVPHVDDAEAAQWESEVRAESDVEDEEDDEEEIHGHGGEDEDDEDDDGDDDDSDHGPVGMCPPPGEGDGDDNRPPEGAIRPESSGSDSAPSGEGQVKADGQPGGDENTDAGRARRRHRRGRRGGRMRRRDREEGGDPAKPPVPRAQGVIVGAGAAPAGDEGDDSYQDASFDVNANDSDRSALTEQSQAGQKAQEAPGEESGQMGRPEVQAGAAGVVISRSQPGGSKRAEFKETRSRDKRIRSKSAAKPVRAQANIQDLLKEGQEVIVQVAKDPISTKGARLTCHISLPGRHLVCMPTIDHVGVSRRIERDDERRKLREYVERYRPKNLGFIVRTASGRQQSEKRIKQDIEYLTRLWAEIREKAAEVTAPALVYEDLNSVLRAIRDWVTEDIDKIVVDSRYHYNDILRFASHFMPSLKQKVELYHGDVPIFDAYNISTELARGLERKVWLKSGGYLVVDQAEALVAIDVNTGRFVGKKNLEDTILKTNLEAVLEIAYQLRLRNCGGIIILDLIDMEREENKQRVYRALEEALKKDRARPSILKISELGLVEMTRKRTRDTMVRALCEACTHCEGKGFVKSKQTVAYEILRELERVGIERDLTKVLVQAHPDVIDILAIEERDTLDQLERRYRKQLFLQAVLDYHMERFEVTGDKREKGERGIEVSSESGSRRGRDGQNDRDGGRDRERGRGRNRGRDRDRGSNSRDGGRDRGAPQVRPVDGSVIMVDPGVPVGSFGSSGDATGVSVVLKPTGVIVPRAAGIEVGAPKPGGPGTGGGDDFYSEEDRLAFLRAQATQDAALARLGGNAAGQNGQRGGGSSNGGGGGAGMGLGRAPVEGGRGDRGGEGERGGRRGRRGRRGGTKQRRTPNDRPAGVSTAPVIQPRGTNGGGGGSEGHSSGSEGGGSSGGDGGGAPAGGGGGGGDHSNPPST